VNSNDLYIGIDDTNAYSCYYRTFARSDVGGLVPTPSAQLSHRQRICDWNLGITSLDCPLSGSQKCELRAYAASADGTAGNQATCIMNIDNILPSVQLTCTPQAGKCGGSTCLKGTQFTLTATAADTPSGADLVEIRRNDQPMTGGLQTFSGSSPATHTLTYTANDAGSVSFTASALDRAGNLRSIAPDECKYIIAENKKSLDPWEVVLQVTGWDGSTRRSGAPR
jgi:hypothetical protein